MYNPPNNSGLPPQYHRSADGSMIGDKAENHKGDPAWDSNAGIEEVSQPTIEVNTQVFVKPISKAQQLEEIKPAEIPMKKPVDVEVSHVKQTASAKKADEKTVAAKK